MRPVQVMGLAVFMTALAAPAPVPPPQTVARSQIEAAVALEKAKHYDDAIALLSRALAAKALSASDTARALFDRGLAYEGLGNARAALADYSAALHKEPALSQALSNRADLLRRADRLDEAKRDYWAALKCPTGKREYPYYGLGLIAEREANALVARDYFQLALAANPNFGPAARHLALVLSPKNESGLRSAVNDAPGLEPSRILPVETGRAMIFVQLGAFQNETLAQGAWAKIAAGSGDVLRGLTPLVSAVDIAGKGRLWRLRTVVASPSAAASLCAALTQRQLVCAVIRR